MQYNVGPVGYAADVIDIHIICLFIRIFLLVGVYFLC